ncbi:hypothetical protein ACVXZ4_13385 [Lacisediminihabitans sp. FW035]
MQSTHTSWAFVAAMAVTCTLLAGCSSAPGSERAGEIASLATPHPKATSETNPLFEKYGEPIRLRLDMTDGEQQAAYKNYVACIADEGGHVKGKKESGAATGAGSADQGAEAFCAAVSPLPPWELDRSNPDALAFVQGVVDCLRGKGVTKVAIAPDDGSGQVSIAYGGADNDSRSISLGLQYTSECQRTVSAATK